MPSKKALYAAAGVALAAVGAWFLLRRFAPTLLDLTKIGANAAIDLTRTATFGPVAAAAQADDQKARTA